MQKKRLAINIIAQIITFSVQFLISFLITPFIVQKLGADAYGFIGLTDNFVMYAQVVTIALNSMAGRFVTIAYHKNNIEEANLLFSSVFYANIFISAVILAASVLVCAYLEFIVNIPEHLIFDVKVLFTLIFFNFVISIVFSTYQVATFIKNRLELNAIRSIASNIFRVGVLLVGFGLFVPHLWYMGVAAIASTTFVAFSNVQYTKRLTPELKVSLKNFSFKHLLTIISSGIWNSFNKLGNIFGESLDLLFANLFIGPVAMGYLSISKKIPVIVLSLIGSICAAFAPSLTKKYATGDVEGMRSELLLSVKLAGALGILPCSFLFVFGKMFYQMWIPESDANCLYILTSISIMIMPIALSLEGVQNIFLITNKVRTYSICTFIFNMLVFATLFTCISFIEEDSRIYFLVCVSAFWMMLKVVLFLPMYSAKCINEKYYFFYPSILRVLITLLVCCSALEAINNVLCIDSWLYLILAGLFTVIIDSCVIFCILFSKEDRGNVGNMIKKLIFKK